jgi:hypothetical protein
MATMTIHVQRQDVGAIAWASTDAPHTAVVCAAWVLPGQTFFGLSCPELIAAAEASGTVEVDCTVSSMSSTYWWTRSSDS